MAEDLLPFHFGVGWRRQDGFGAWNFGCSSRRGSESQGSACLPLSSPNSPLEYSPRPTASPEMRCSLAHLVVMLAGHRWRLCLDCDAFPTFCFQSSELAKGENFSLVTITATLVQPNLIYFLSWRLPHALTTYLHPYWRGRK